MTTSAARYFASAAAILFAPVGWFVGGFSAAQRMANYELAISSTATITRPLYVPGVYLGHSLTAALFAWLVVFLCAQGVMRRHNKTT